MPMTAAVRFVFSGDIDCASFLGFARHRAGRLDLSIDIGACDPASATVTVGGQPDLVDMFEMACSLGPYDCIIYDVARTETAFPVGATEQGGIE